MMTVSGKIIYDEFGRTIEEYYPTVCSIADTNIVDENFDNIQPTKTEYDQLDRQVKITLPTIQKQQPNMALALIILTKNSSK